MHDEQLVNNNAPFNVREPSTGKEKLTNVELNLGVAVSNRYILTDLEADNATVVTMNYTDKSTGIKEGLVEIIDENLYFDNRFYFTYKVEESVQILVINDENSTPYPGLVYATDDFYSVKETAVGQLKSNELNEADLIV